MQHNHMTRTRVAALIGFAGLYLFSVAGVAQPVADPAGFWNEVTLYRDEYGTPHIQAESVRSMAFAFGYAQAEDHLEPMLMAYRVAMGRAAAVRGESFAESDAFALKIANAQVSSVAMAQADPMTRDLCEGFALGINAWILEHQNQVPDWAEGVQPVDVLAYWHYLMVATAPFDLPGIYHPPPPLERANTWALAPQNTLEGATLLVMNPHEYYDGPYRWYEAHLMVGDVNWAGATLFGVPVLMMGHNDVLGWGLSPNGADTADFFEEQIGGPPVNPADPRFTASAIDDVAPLLSFMANAKPFYVRTATGLVERAVPSLIGSRGPIFEGKNGVLYSWGNGAFQQFGGLRQLLLMGQARSLPEFQQALSQQQLPCFQVVYGDKAGNIFYAYNARLGNKQAAIAADEPRPVDWTMPVNAGRYMFLWRDFITPSQLPHIENPESGYLQACGTPPWLATVNSGLNPADWPGWLVPEQPNYRVFRVNQILSSGRYSFRDMQAMLFDTLVPAAVDMVPLLLTMADARPELIRTAHPDLVTAMRLLRNWDLRADENSAALAYYNIWWALMKRRHADEFKSEAGLYQGLLANTPAAQAYALDAAAEAARVMRNDFSSLSLPWGNLHRIHRGNRNEPMFGTGTGDPIFYADNQTFVNRQWHTNFGYGFAMAVQFGEETRAASIVPFGASERPQSPHYQDQMGLFTDRRMKRTRFLHDDVIAHASSGLGRRVVLGSPALEGTCTIVLERPQRVTLEEITMPPRPFPGGQVPFTPAIRPVFPDGPVNHSWTVELRVPADRCDPAYLSRLQLHTYAPEKGWTPLAGQAFNRTHEVFSGSGSGSVMIAVLGPHDLLIEPAPDAPDDSAVLAVAPAPDDFLRGPIVTPIPEPGSEGMADVAETDGEGLETEARSEVPAQKPLFDIEFMETVPGLESDDVAEGVEDEGRRGRKKRKAEEEAAAEAAATDAEPEVGNAPVVQQRKHRAPRKNFGG